ncbi:hypothetical protein EVAR_55803_1 [Eumeta japonica]|uniref:Uncharacterized protein n=1 Tax=Eumeta variegata TaxID=151549 RepID=A0A4C1YTL9_EUMVA|nr:hypothetical protein EVAR_55803_1 [Eumeta japonica]
MRDEEHNREPEPVSKLKTEPWSKLSVGPRSKFSIKLDPVFFRAVIDSAEGDNRRRAYATTDRSHRTVRKSVADECVDR